MSDYIPFEIQLEIVKRLPLKSMVRFRLVSKLWNSFIGSSDFISTYNEHHPHPPPRLLARYYHHINTSEQICVSIIDDETFIQQKFSFNNINKQLKHSAVIDCSHGLLCFHGLYYGLAYKSPKEMVILWNPLIRKSVCVELPSNGLRLRESNSIVGFGVCHVTKDPTIVKIKQTCILREDFVPGPWVVQVYTLSSRTWKTLKATNMSRIQITNQSSSLQAVVDRFTYWTAFKRILVHRIDSEKAFVNMIVSFDMATHEFEGIHLPVSLSHIYTMLDVCKLHDSLALLEDYSSFRNDKVCRVWKMENGIKKSFTKIFTICSPNTFSRTVLAFRKSGEPMMETLNNNNDDISTVEAYDPCSKQFVDLGIYVRVNSLFVSSYIETLLLLDQTDCHIFYNENKSPRRQPRCIRDLKKKRGL